MSTDNRSRAPAISWVCHAHPAELGGQPCGHVNHGTPLRGLGALECCQRCGCTRIASEARRARLEAK